MRVTDEDYRDIQGLVRFGYKHLASARFYVLTFNDLTAAGAWLAALAVFLLVATPLWQPGQPLAITIVVAILAGCLMAATVAVLTGFSAVRLVNQRRHATGPSSSDAARSEAR